MATKLISFLPLWGQSMAHTANTALTMIWLPALLSPLSSNNGSCRPPTCYKRVTIELGQFQGAKFRVSAVWVRV